MRGLENDVYFQVGLLTVVGLSAKNAILIVEFANEINSRGRQYTKNKGQRGHQNRPQTLTRCLQRRFHQLASTAVDLISKYLDAWAGK